MGLQSNYPSKSGAHFSNWLWTKKSLDYQLLGETQGKLRWRRGKPYNFSWSQELEKLCRDNPQGLTFACLAILAITIQWILLWVRPCFWGDRVLSLWSIYSLRRQTRRLTNNGLCRMQWRKSARMCNWESTERWGGPKQFRVTREDLLEEVEFELYHGT